MKITSLITLFALGLAGIAMASEPSPTNVLLIDHAKVDDAFAKGQLLLTNEHYKVIAGRRVAAGVV